MQILQLGLVILFFVCCIVLVFLILIQSGKGGSLGIFGGAGSSTAFGSSTVDVVTKATWYGTIGFFSLALLCAWAFADSGPRAPDAAKLPTESGLPAGLPAPGKTAGETPTPNTAAPTGTGTPAGQPPAGTKNP